MASPTPQDPTPVIADWMQLSLGDSPSTSSTAGSQPATLLKGVHAGSDTFRQDTAVPPPATPPFVPGYEILGELGRGGMGVVYQARQLGLNRLVALKMILSGSHARPEDLARFRAEAEAVAQLQHPHIVQIHEIGELHGLPFFSLEYVAGGSLDRVLDGQPQPPAQAAALIEQIADAVHVAHGHGTVHRDLKPANILLQIADRSLPMDASAGPDSLKSSILDLHSAIPKIADFGLAKRLAMDSGHTRTGEIIGTPCYMAPEQAAGQVHEVGPAADVYALGAILYEMLTGRPPFKGLTPMETVLQVLGMDPVAPRQLMPRLPADLETICLKCLHKEPAQRYATALELAADLRRWRKGEAILARPLGRLARTWRWCRRNPAVASLLGAVLVSLAAGTAVSAFFAIQAARQAEDALTEKHRADMQAEDARRERQRADANFARAKQAVQEYLTAVAGEPRLQEADFFTLRKKLLTTALPLYQELGAQKSDDPAFIASRQDALSLLVIIHEKVGDLPAAIAAARELKTLLQQQLTVAPENAPLQKSLALTHANLGMFLHQRGQPREAEEALRQGIDLAQQLARNQPELDLARTLASMRRQLADARYDLGHPEEAEKLLRDVVAELREMSHAAPQDQLLGIELNTAQEHLGTLLIRRGRLTDAEKEYLAARAHWEQERKATGPRVVDSRAHQVGLTYQLGRLYTDQGRWTDAERESQASLQAAEQLVREFPSIARYRLLLGLSRTSYAVVLHRTGRLPTAEQQLQQARELLEPLAPADGPDPKPRQELGRVHHLLGGVLLDAGRAPEAEKQYRRALEIYQELTRRYPALNELRHELAAVHLQIGNLGLTTNQPDMAEAAFRQCLGILEQLVVADPGNLKHRLQIGGCLCNLGHVETSRARTTAALAWYDRAAQTLEQVRQRDSQSILTRIFLRNVQFGRTGALFQLGRLMEALEANEKAMTMDDGSQRLTVQRQRYAVLGGLLTRWQQAVQTQQESEALALAERLARVEPIADEQAWEAARLCARALDETPGTTDGRYAALALTFLTKAAHAGYFQKNEHRDALHQSPDFAPLRNRPEFQKWVETNKLKPVRG